MSDKRKLSTILGIAGATVLAAGGSAYITDTGLSLVDNTTAEVLETDAGLEVAKETEQPMTVETFTATKDSFTVKPTSATKKETTETEQETETDSDGNVVSSSEDSGTAGDGTSSGDSSGSGSSTGESSAEAGSGYYDEDGNYYYYDEDGLLHDEWGGYYAENGDYYDGNGGYWDGDGYHTVSSSDSSSSSSSSSGSSSSSSSSSGSSSSGSSSSSGAWDDSYMMYDVDSRYVSEDELSSWSSEDLAKLRNEIFARHGRIFTTQKWIDYFATKTWYTPQYDNVDDQLNDYEWANLEVILKLEAERS